MQNAPPCPVPECTGHGGGTPVAFTKYALPAGLFLTYQAFELILNQDLRWTTMDRRLDSWRAVCRAESRVGARAHGRFLTAGRTLTGPIRLLRCGPGGEYRCREVLGNGAAIRTALPPASRSGASATIRARSTR
jgi:hypothetical protein